MRRRVTSHVRAAVAAGLGGTKGLAFRV